MKEYIQNKRYWLIGGIVFVLLIVLGILYWNQKNNLSSLQTGIDELKIQIDKLPSATVTSKATMTQKIATLEKQIKSLPETPETLPIKKLLIQQLDDLQQQIDTFPDNSISDKDRLSLEKDRLSLEKDLATARNAIWGTLLQALSAIFFVSTYFTWRNVKTAEEKQITERFSKAVELLGNDMREVRAGGIYALERIAKDSPKDHWTIMEVLTSFIQEKSLLQRQQNTPITIDVQAALTVIGRRDHKQDAKRKKIVNSEEIEVIEPIDLRSTNLVRANLSEANLMQANLSKADLSFARNLNVDQVKSARNWKAAYYHEEFRKELGL